MNRQDAQIFDPFEVSYGVKTAAEMDWGATECPTDVGYPADVEYPAETELTSEESLDWERPQPVCERVGLGDVLHMFAEASGRPFVWWEVESRAGAVSGLVSSDSIEGFAAALGADEPKSLGYVPAFLEQTPRLSRPDVDGLVRAHLTGGSIAYIYPTVFVLELFGIEALD